MSEESEKDQQQSTAEVEQESATQSAQAENSTQDIPESEVSAEEVAEENKLQEQLDGANDQLLRLQAEMQNVRRRAERDVESAHKYALEKFATELLSVVDNLERALGTIDRDDESQKSVFEGIDLTLKGFLDVLARFKVEAVEPNGQPFDADFHQAVSMVPNGDVEANTVIEVFQKGYTLNGRLIRPAMVVVSTAP
ncbi:MAG: nucleotide exchange factor GrpE [Porticoccaceae bacterium]